MAVIREVTKGVIAAAGRGSRFRPATNVVPKEMFPIGNVPIIQHLVEEFINSGVTDIMIVITPEKKMIMDHLNSVEEIVNKSRLCYCFQRAQYGNGVPLLDAAGFIGSDPFAFAFADDFVLSSEPFTRSLLLRNASTRCPVIGVDSVPEELVSRYGVIDMIPGTSQVRRLVEKPKREDAPSTLVQFGRMVLVPEIVELLKTTPVGKGGELWLADAVMRYIEEGGIVLAERIEHGRWCDTGNPLAYAEAYADYMLAHEEYGSDFRVFLRDHVERRGEKK